MTDCFEIFIERPSGLEARAKTWSSYKHHNTVTFLIGITPQGAISFLSNGWGVSDKYLTENSGFLNNLIPGDVVLAHLALKTLLVYCVLRLKYQHSPEDGHSYQHLMLRLPERLLMLEYMLKRALGLFGKC